jgi:hypothetical protein
MQLPRRVPWATLVELDQLCQYIYAQDAHSTRNLAIERVRIARVCKLFGLPYSKKKSSPRGDS